MERIVKFFSLPTVEKTVFFRALILLVVSRFLLQFRQFKNVINYFSRKSAAQKTTLDSIIPPSKVAKLLSVAGNIIPFSTCLSKSLAGSVLFRSLGYQTQLNIGVAREKGFALEAHAWLTLDGIVIVGNRSDLERYRELPCIFDDGKKTTSASSH